jgi:hypothetical protein
MKAKKVSGIGQPLNKQSFTVKREKWKDTHYHSVSRNSKGHFIANKKWRSKEDTQHIKNISLERFRPPPPSAPPPPPPPPPPPRVDRYKLSEHGLRYKITVKITLSRVVSLARGDKLDFYYMSLTSKSKELSWENRQRIEEFVRSRKENIYKDARIIDVKIVRIIDRETGEKWLYE